MQVSREAASNQDQAQSVRYHIRATGIHTDYGNAPLDLLGPCDRDPALDDATCSASAVCDCDLATFDPSQTAMWVHFMDNDVDGVHDPYPSELQAANGVKDTWPRLYLEYIGTPTTTPDGTVSFENPLAQNLFEWPPDSNRVRPERWVAENYTVAYDLIFLGPTGIAADPTNPFSPFPVFEMNMLFSPAFRHYHADGAYAVDPANGPYDLLDIRCYTSDAGVYPDFASCTGEEIDWNDVPAGAWSLTLVTESGQTWSVPNEIGVPQLAFAVGLDAPLESTDLSVFDVRSQASYLLLE